MLLQHGGSLTLRTCNDSDKHAAAPRGRLGARLNGSSIEQKNAGERMAPRTGKMTGMEQELCQKIQRLATLK